MDTVKTNLLQYRPALNPNRFTIMPILGRALNLKGVHISFRYLRDHNFIIMHRGGEQRLANYPIKKSLKVILAVVVNVALFTALIVYLLNGKESVLWSIVLPSACHIVLCSTLIYFLHKDSDWNFFF